MELAGVVDIVANLKIPKNVSMLMAIVVEIESYLEEMTSESKTNMQVTIAIEIEAFHK